MLTNRNETELAAQIRRQVPSCPGVYWFKNTNGDMIYLGKSVNLRRRMLSYFRPTRSQPEERIKRMIFTIAGFGFRETETELLALLLEDALIKRNHPPYNIRQREHSGYCHVALTDHDYPALRMVNGGEAEGLSVFGPFRDQYVAAEIKEIVCCYFGLRSCTEAVPIRKCLSLDLGLCVGPCERRVLKAVYRLIGDQVADFLEGDIQQIEQKVRDDMVEAAAALDYEKAGEIKATLGFCKRFGRRRRFTNKFRAGSLLIEERDGTTYRFIDGNLIEVQAADGGSRRPVRVPDELGRAESDSRFVFDRADLVYSWLNRNRDRVSFSFETATEEMRPGPESTDLGFMEMCAN